MRGWDCIASRAFDTESMTNGYMTIAEKIPTGDEALAAIPLKLILS